ncbi:hypothetical protein [Pedobacter sp.]
MPKVYQISDVQGSKAYFTGFDYLLLNSKRNKEVYISEIERTFKLLLLSKSNIVCPVSHLYTPQMFDFLSKNPFILEKSLVIPAQRSNVTDPMEFLTNYEVGSKTKIDSEKKREMISFFNQYIPATIRWESTETMDRFKTNLLIALNNPNSILNSSFKNIDQQSIQLLILAINDSERVNRYILQKAVSKWSPFNKAIFKNYINLEISLKLTTSFRFKLTTYSA